MFNFKLRSCVVIFLFILREIEPKISDKRLCANENCTKPISQAKTLLAYASPEYGILSFKSNAEATVYSKSAGSNMDLWGVEIEGARGYAPKIYLRETKILTKNVTFLVETDTAEQEVPSSEPDTQTTIKASKVPEFIIFDGTTLYADPEEAISPTPTVNNILPTVTVQNSLDTDNGVSHTETQPLEKVDLEGIRKGNDEGGDKKETEDKDKVDDKEDDQEEADVEEEDEEEEEDYEDDYESDEESEEFEDNEDENAEKISDDLKEEDSDSKSGDVPSEPSKSDLISEEIKMNDMHENTVKGRQLLSEKGSMDNPLNAEIDANINAPLSGDTNDSKTDTTTDHKAECTSETCSKPDTMQDIPVNKDIFIETVIEEKITQDTSINEEISTETVTESAYAHHPGFEIPVPGDYAEDVTPNPIKEGENDIGSDPNKENVELVSQTNILITNQSEDNAESTSVKSEPNLGENKESTKIEEIFIGGHKIETSESESTTENSSKVEQKIGATSDISETPGEINDTLGLPEQSKEGDADEVEDNVESQTHTAGEGTQIVSEQSNDTDILTGESSNESELNVLGNDEGSSSTEQVIDTTLASIPEAQTEIPNDTASEEPQTQHPTKEENPIVDAPENPENTSGMFGSFSNWFGNDQEEQEDPVGDTNIEDDNLKTDEDNEEEPVEILSDKETETVPPALIENHDHDFLSIFGEPQNVATSEPLQSTESSEVITEAPKVENVVEEKENEYAEARDESVQVQGSFVGDEIQDEEVSVSEETRNQYEAFKELVQDEFNAEDTITDVAESEEIVEDSRKAEHLGDVFDVHEQLISKNSVGYGSCPAGESDCPADISMIQKQLEMEEIPDAPFYADFLNLLTLLGVTGFTVAVFLLGFISIDKNRKEGTLIAKINTLEKALLVASKENALLADRVLEIQDETAAENDRISSEEFDNLNRTYQEVLSTKSVLEDQIQSLEKELENSTEVGLELNRMLSDILSSQNGSETLIANVEQLQRQLVEQQGTINTVNDTLNLKDTENHELQLELEIKNKKVTHLQAELDKMAMNLFKVEEDKEQAQARLEGEILVLKDQLEQRKNSFNSSKNKLLDEIAVFKSKFSEVQRNLDVKTNEYTILKDNFNQIKAIKNNTEALESLLNASAMKAELQQLQRDNQTLNDHLKQEQQTKFTLEKQIEIALQEAQGYRAKYDEADKEKLEARTKLEVLSNYFKEREAQLQKELSKQESMWTEKQGETTSNAERVKYMKEELQNCKSQNELLKQEIVSQEVELKSQISVLEKKSHESWVAARQAERRLEDARQEAAQLRNRLTLKERSFIEEKNQNRMQSPLEQNGDVAISPLHLPVDTPASPPPLLYGTRDHLTTSPPLPNLPPFLPPPPGVPFMPPPIPGVPGFMPPPPPSMFPGDHRPPPLGRMSSPPPPLNSRYSPDSRYSPYDRNSPSPPYDDEYGSTPPPMPRGYSPYNNRDDRRDFKRPPPPPHRANGRNKGAMSSGSGNSNESLEKINRHHSKV